MMGGIMSRRFFPLLCLILLASPARAAEPAVVLHMSSGQILEQVVRVYVEADLDAASGPRLCLYRFAEEMAGAAAARARGDCRYRPFEVLSGQAMPVIVDGRVMGVKRATLLLFDLSGYVSCRPLGVDCFKSISRVVPVLKWKEGDREWLATTQERVYLGRRSAGVWWTLVISLAFLLVVWRLTRAAGNGILGLLSTSDGYMSVALTQMALWTLAIGATVLGFGLIRLEIPDIPDTLVMLMGLSVTTSAVGHWQTRRLRFRLVDGSRPAAGDGRKPRVGDLFTVGLPGARPGEEIRVPSLAQAQVLFWTVITLALFVVKSIVDGRLWEVPAEMVALMGISQAGYMGRMQMAVSDAERKSAP
jgi:hypothetical protein